MNFTFILFFYIPSLIFVLNTEFYIIDLSHTQNIFLSKKQFDHPFNWIQGGRQQ